MQKKDIWLSAAQLRDSRPFTPTDAIWLALALLFGAATRFVLVYEAGFVFNDGGLVAAIIQALQEHPFAWPTHVDFNALQVPLAQPLLAHALAALLNAVGVPLLAMLRWGPALLCLLSIVPFHLLARQLVPAQVPAGLAAVIYAVAPLNVAQLSMGGSLPRALGLLLALTAIARMLPLLQHRQTRDVLLCGVLGGLATLADAGSGLFALVSLVVLSAGFLHERQTWRVLGQTVGLALLVALPWWGVVLLRLGPQPWLQAMQSRLAPDGNPLQAVALAAYDVLFAGGTLATLGVIGSGLTLIGLLVAIVRYGLLFPLWLTLTVTLVPHGKNYTVVLLACTAGLALAEVLYLWLVPVWQRTHVPHDAARDESAVLQQLPDMLLLLCLVFACYLFVRAMNPFMSDPAYVQYRSASLTPAAQQAMRWCQQHTPADARFLVVPQRAPGEVQCEAHWFPYFAKRTSLTTAQGLQWLDAAACHQRRDRVVNLVDFAADSLPKLQQWARQHGESFRYVFVGPQAIARRELLQSAKTQPGYQVVYEQDKCGIIACATASQ